MNFQALKTVLYEIACMTLSRVKMKTNPGLIGLVIQQDRIAGTVQVHWGVDNKKPIQTWHSVHDLMPVTFSKELSNGH